MKVRRQTGRLTLVLIGAWMVAMASPLRGAGEVGGGAALDVSGYPAEQQRQYKIVAEKCTRCHDLSRPLTAKYNDTGWRELVQRMSRKPGANISRRDQQQIAAFLIFYGRQSRTGSTTASSPGDASPAPATAPIIVGKAAQGGVRLEVSARPAQSVLQLVNGQWAQVAPAAGENTYLEVRLYDAESGEKLPYATVKVRFMSDTGNGSERALAPSYGPEGFHYGGNVIAPRPLRVQLTIEPPLLARVGDGASRWMNPITLDFKVSTE